MSLFVHVPLDTVTVPDGAGLTVETPLAPPIELALVTTLPPFTFSEPLEFTPMPKALPEPVQMTVPPVTFKMPLPAVAEPP